MLQAVEKVILQEMLQKKFSSAFSKGGRVEGQSPRRPPQRTKFYFLKAQEGRKTSQWDVLRWGTLAGGAPMRRIKIMNLCILLFVNSFFDKLKQPGGSYRSCPAVAMISERS